MDTIQTRRLTLRTWEHKDADDLFEYAQSEEVGPNAGWPPHTNIEESTKIIEQFIKSDEVWAVVHKEHQKVIGSLGMHRDQKRPAIHCRMIGYVLSKDYWGLGIIPEAVKAVLEYAFDTLQLELVSVYHFPDNLRSRRVIEKCGFQFEGTLRKSTKIFDGTVYDDVCYSMTREDYLKTKKSDH